MKDNYDMNDYYDLENKDGLKNESSTSGSNNRKVLIGIVIVLISICCLCVVLPLVAGSIGMVSLQSAMESAVVEDPVQAAEIGHQIMAYELPNGYEEQMAVSLMGIKMIFISPDEDVSMMIILAQFPAILGLSETEMMEQVESIGLSGPEDTSIELTNVGTDEVIINGEIVELTIKEGEEADGDRVRQVVGTFTAENKAPTLIMIIGSPEGWDDGAYQRFFNPGQQGR